MRRWIAGTPLIGNPARSAGACLKALDGFGMLVEQAAVAFEYWRGVKVDSAAVLAQLRREMAEG